MVISLIPTKSLFEKFSLPSSLEAEWGADTGGFEPLEHEVNGTDPQRFGTRMKPLLPQDCARFPSAHCSAILF